jgi:hypothetical protein
MATRLVNGTQLRDPKVRQQLFEGGKKAIAASQDPMIKLAQLVDPDARAIRKNFEENIESVIRKNSELVAKAKFDAYGTNVYPDATFSLRLSYGSVQGYMEDGKKVNPLTAMAGTFERHTGEDPFALPQSWLDAKGKIKGTTPMNFGGGTPEAPTAPQYDPNTGEMITVVPAGEKPQRGFLITVKATTPSARGRNLIEEEFLARLRNDLALKSAGKDRRYFVARTSIVKQSQLKDIIQRPAGMQPGGSPVSAIGLQRDDELPDHCRADPPGAVHGAALPPYRRAPARHRPHSPLRINADARPAGCRLR